MTDCLLDLPDVESAHEWLRLSQFSVENAADAIFWVRRDARMIYVNEQAVRIAGLFARRVVDDAGPRF